MRTVRASAIALICLIPLTHSFNAAEDPLPLAQPKSADIPNEPSQASAGPDLFIPAHIELEVFPITDYATKAVAIQTSDPGTLLNMLRDAVEANDLDQFNAVLARARTAAESSPELRRAVSVYSDIQQVWQFSVNDRFGAFYDDESLPGVRQRLSTEYSGYESYINEHRIVDQNGRAFYPTAETRTFLLRQLGTAHIAARPKVVATAPAPAPVPAQQHVAPRAKTKPAPTPAPATTPAKHKTLKKAETIVPPKPKPVTIAEKKPEPVKIAPAPAPTPVPAPVEKAVVPPVATTTTQAPPPPVVTQSTTPAPTPAPVQEPVTTSSAATTSQATDSATTSDAQTAKDAGDNNPAILILILGVVALGVTMFLLRRTTPKPPVQTLTPKPDVKPEGGKSPEGEKPAPRQASGSR